MSYGDPVPPWPGPDDATRAKVAEAIDEHPLIASLLYDIDLLPEQIRDERRYGYMLAVIGHMKQALQSARLGSMAIYDPATGKCRGECNCEIGQTCKAYLVYRSSRTYDGSKLRQKPD